MEQEAQLQSQRGAKAARNGDDASLGTASVILTFDDPKAAMKDSIQDEQQRSEETGDEAPKSTHMMYP